jgi:hypothetical protein
MGTWGALPFENDNASDWVWNLEEAEDTSVLTDTLEAVADAEEIEEDSEEAVAAAEVVAAMLGKPLPEVPGEVEAFVKRQGKKKPPTGLVDLAVKAVKRISKESDLKERWKEADGEEEWQDSLKDLLKRLAV